MDMITGKSDVRRVRAYGFSQRGLSKAKRVTPHKIEALDTKNERQNKVHSP